MKDIIYLNSKWWYRLLKVFFFFLFLLCIMLAVFFVYAEYNPTQIRDLKVDCVGDYTNNKSFLAQKDLGIYIYQYDIKTIYQSIQKDDKLRFREACDLTDEEASALNNKTIIYINEQEKLGTNEDTMQKYIDQNLRPYLISETYYTKGGYTLIVLYSLLSVVIILLIAEAIRRLFYYIFLGTFNPKTK